MAKHRLIKFDIIHPTEYLAKKKAEWTDLKDLSLEEYRERLIALRSNYSDFYTYHLNQSGEWRAEEYFLMDPDFTEKMADRLFGRKKFYYKNRYARSKRTLKLSAGRWERFVMDAYLRKEKPDVIFARSQPIPSRHWQKYRKDSLLVARLSARLPYNWHPNHWDLIYTDQPDFQTFFRLHGVDCILNDQGFDARIPTELEERPSRHDVTFVGGLGTKNFTLRTNFINQLVSDASFDFKWWGYWWPDKYDTRTLDDFPALAKTFQGVTSGLEMYQLFQDSKIVLNDYVDTANGEGFNQRIFEALGSGSFMLTRKAQNFKGTFPDGLFATYESLDEAREKIKYYLDHPEERKEMAEKGKKFIAANYDYTRIAKSFSEDLKRRLK